MVEKSGVEMSSLKVKGHFNHELLNPMIQNSMVQKSGVEKFMVEKSGVEAWV